MENESKTGLEAVAAGVTRVCWYSVFDVLFFMHSFIRLQNTKEKKIIKIFSILVFCVMHIFLFHFIYAFYFTSNKKKHKRDTEYKIFDAKSKENINFMVMCICIYF